MLSEITLHLFFLIKCNFFFISFLTLWPCPKINILLFLHQPAASQADLKFIFSLIIFCNLIGLYETDFNFLKSKLY